MFDILAVCNCQDSKLCCIPHTFNRVCSLCPAAGTNVAYLILISWLTPEKLLMILRFQSWYCRVKVTQRQDGAGTYTAHLQLQHLVYTDTGKWRGWGNWRALYFLFPGSYVCSFNDSQDRISPESNSKVYIFVFDEINLLTHSGFDFQQSVAYKSAQIPCRWVAP